MSAKSTIRYLSLVNKMETSSCGISDYLKLLTVALEKQSSEMSIYEFNWAKNGLIKSFFKFIKELPTFKDKTIIIQYTAFSWSRKGIPTFIFIIIFLLKMNHNKVAIFFHDPDSFPWNNFTQGIRSFIQRIVMRLLYHASDITLIAIDPKRIPWLPLNAHKAFLSPIGSNVPEREIKSNNHLNRISIFCVTKGPAMKIELEEISSIIIPLTQKHKNLELLICGSGSIESKEMLQNKLKDFQINLNVTGESSLDDIADLLNNSKALLFIRGAITCARGSALAGIATKVPLVGYRGNLTSYPLTESGILLASNKNQMEITQHLDRLLSDEKLSLKLRNINDSCYHQFFSWEAIAISLNKIFG